MILRPAVATLLFLSFASPLKAQTPTKNPAAMAMAPLPAPELPDGTVTVRVARNSLANPAVGAEVVATVAVAKGKTETRTAKAGPDGRATFEKIPAGAAFQAKVTLDGQILSTAEFAMPDKGGVRFLLVSDEGATEEDRPGAGEADPHAGMANPHAGMAGARPGMDPAAMPQIRSGHVAPKEGTPAGRLTIRILGSDGSPLSGQAVRLAKMSAGKNDLDFTDARSDETGAARWDGLQISKDIRYAALVERDGMRVGTDPFVMDEKQGLDGEVRLPGRTNDLRVLRIAAVSRMMFEPREDSLSVLQNLVVENTSNALFEPDAKGVLLPLPAGFSGAEKMPGGADLDLLEGQGAILRAAIPPGSSVSSVAQARMAFSLSTKGLSSVDIVQPMPLGMAGALVMVPSQLPITLSAPGLREKPAERDDNGAILRIFELDAVQPGAALRLTIGGLPTQPRLGKWITGGLCLLLVAGGIAGARRKRLPSPATKA